MRRLPAKARRVTGRVLLLTPSRGLGGGIERYAETLEWALASRGVGYSRVDLHRSGAYAHAQLVALAGVQLRASTAPTRLVAVHRNLLPAASVLAARHGHAQGISVVCHGSDVWVSGHRRRVENYLMRRPGVRVVAVSSFTAGALACHKPAAILPPGLSGKWFATLVETAATRRCGPGIHLLTAFRLADWRDKGLPELLRAVATLGRPDVHLTICGSGEPPDELLRLIGEHSHCTLRAGLTDSDFARQLAAADLFILATRTRPGRDACGEGFGLVLLEAQVAGTPVIAPAHGGSHDAYVDGVTGVAPADETAEALARVLGELLQDPERLARMGQRASGWARESFAPERYASRTVAALL
jgi:glycosyltransferase involved in cell wall biosynthesis